MKAANVATHTHTTHTTHTYGWTDRWHEPAQIWGTNPWPQLTPRQGSAPSPPLCPDPTGAMSWRQTCPALLGEPWASRDASGPALRDSPASPADTLGTRDETPLPYTFCILSQGGKSQRLSHGRVYCPQPTTHQHPQRHGRLGIQASICLIHSAGSLSNPPNPEHHIPCYAVLTTPPPFPPPPPLCPTLTAPSPQLPSSCLCGLPSPLPHP